MWDKIFKSSQVVFLAGMLALLLGGYVAPDSSPVAIPLGAALAGAGGIAAVVSGIILVLARDPGS